MKDQQGKSGESYRAEKENNDFSNFEIMDGILCDSLVIRSIFTTQAVSRSRKNPANFLNIMPSFLTKRNIQILMSA